MPRARRILRAGSDDDGDISGLLDAATPATPAAVAVTSAAPAQPAPASVVESTPSQLQRTLGTEAVSSPTRTSAAVGGMENALVLFADGRRVALWNPALGFGPEPGVDFADGHERFAAAIAAAADDLGIGRRRMRSDRDRGDRGERADRGDRGHRKDHKDGASRRRHGRSRERAGGVARRAASRHASGDEHAHSDAGGESPLSMAISVPVDVVNAGAEDQRFPTTAASIAPPEPEEQPPAPRRVPDSDDSDDGDLLLLTGTRPAHTAGGASQTAGTFGRFEREVVFGGDGEISLLPPRDSVLRRLRRGEPASPGSDAEEEAEADEEVEEMPDATVLLRDWSRSALDAQPNYWLRDQLRGLGLPVSGTKAALADRLWLAIHPDAPPPVPAHLRGDGASAGRLSLDTRPSAATAEASRADDPPSPNAGRDALSPASGRAHDTPDAARLSAAHRRSSGRLSSVSAPASATSKRGRDTHAVRSDVEASASRVPPQPRADSTPARSPVAAFVGRIGSWLGSAVRRVSPGGATPDAAATQRLSTAVAQATLDPVTEAERETETQLFASPRRRLSALASSVGNRLSAPLNAKPAEPARLSTATEHE